MLSTEEIIARYYVGYYNRAPDPAGFAFWTSNFDNGVTSLEVATYFSNQPETDALYPYFADPANNSPEQFIRSVYQNLFNREPDDEGFDFWMNELTSGGVSTGQMIEAIIQGAVTNPDLAVVQNKVASALYWEDQANNFATFDYDAAAATSANNALSVVTADPATVATSQAQANAFFAQLSEDKADPGAGLTDDGSEDDKVGIAADPLGETIDITLASATSDPVINLQAFRDDPRFAGIDGTGQTVVVIDTGIDLNHPAFGPDRDGNGIADRIIFSRDFTDEGDGTADDEQGHGSNVASIVASSSEFYTGVAPGANIVALQALDRTGSGSTSGIEEALQWVVQNAEALNIVAVNMSLGDSSNINSIRTDPVFGDELRVLNETLGVTTVVAAGNSYADYQSEGASSLSADPNTIAIGAVGGSASSGGLITYFSQRSDDIPTIFAPGSFIEGAAPGGGTSESSGTSQASPHVAGMVALAQQLAQRELGRSLTPDEFATLLEQSGDRFVDSERADDRVINTGSTYSRADMYDLAEAILNLGGGTPTPNPNPTPNPTPTPGNDIPGSINTGATIAVGESQTSTIDFAGDEDFFAVNLTPGEYEISLEGAATGAGSLSDPLLTLLSGGGSFVTSNDDGGAGLNSLIEFVVSEGGTYYINASAYGSATGSYTLEVQRTGGTTGDVGESPGSAGSLNIGASVSSALEFGADRDWFAVQLSAGQDYTFDMVGGTLNDPYLFLYNSAGTVVASNDDGGEGLNASLEFNAGSSGTFYISAEAFSATQTGTYTLTASGQGTSGDDFAANTGTSGSVAAAGGSASGTLEVAGDRDWFRVEVQAGASYDFAVNGNGLSDPYMYLYDSNGNLVGSDDDSGPGLNALLSITANSNETYYIAAGGYSDARTGDYVVTSTQTSQGGGGDVAGDASTTASLAVGQSLVGVIDAPGDTDWYGINVIAGQSYELIMASGGPDPIDDAYLVIYDRLGNPLLENDDFDGTDSLIAFEVFQTGRYFVAAETFSTSDSGTYELSLFETGSSSFLSVSGVSSSVNDYDTFV